MPLKIVVGPEAMFVERHGIRSQTVRLTAQDGPQEVRTKARELARTITRIVAFCVWREHRVCMAWQRAVTSWIMTKWPGPYFPGPTPELVSTKPWRKAVKGEWEMLPSGIVSRLLRVQRGANDA